MAICDHSVKHDFMQVGCLKLEHFINANSAYFICSYLDGIGGAKPTKRGINEILAKLVEEI